jgi:hypothetical protein
MRQEISRKAAKAQREEEAKEIKMQRSSSSSPFFASSLCAFAALREEN